MSVRTARFEAPGTLLNTVVGTATLDRGMRLFATLVVTGLTVVAAQVSIPLPFTPVPFTLQPMVVLLGGADDGVEQRAGGFEPGGTDGHWLQILAYAYCTDNRRQ